MHRRLDGAINRQLTRDAGLSAADYEILVPLSEAPGQRLRARDLGRLVNWEKSRLSHHVGRMERRGLVTRQGCPTDARGAFIQLTDSGRRAMETAAPGHVETVRGCFIDLLSGDELETLASIADRVIQRIDEGAPQDATDTDCGGKSTQRLR
ncbi:winged helix-turn-helix transcriptional regulator [Planosporangium mesophilum]|nr:MarR family winged helix-turn-helix transcriptional regulator [Planosporangium mesophilum]NJC82547.1 winged helix-turn-helix transcriptional regulator [Planosporangium mesophilum]